MLFEQIESNKKKTYGIVFIFLIFTLAVGASATYYITGNFVTGIVLSTLVIAIYIPIVISQGKKIVLSMNHAKKIENSQQAPFLWNTVSSLALVAQIPMPEVYIIEENSPNAFATGLSPNKSAVAVTTALLTKLNREEIEAVIAHEIAHIRNYDVRLTTISLALVSIIALISDIGTRFMFFISKENKNPLIMIVSLIILLLAPIVATMMHFALSRNREFLADASGAELCRNPLALASALEKISQDPDPVDNISASTAGIYFSEPFKKKKKKKKASLLSTHPAAHERIARLRSM